MNTILAAVVNAAIVSVLLAVFVWLSLRMVPRRSLNAATRYVIWWLALLITIALPVLFLPFPQGDARQLGEVSAGIQPEAALALGVISGSASAATIQGGSSPGPVPLLPIRFAEGKWQAWILIVWGILSAVMLGRLVVSCVLLDRRKATATAAPEFLAVRVDQWLSMCGSSRKRVKLGLSDAIPIPIAAGLWEPAILLPTSLMGELSEAELEHVGLHEAAHLARGDDYALLLERIVEALFALHPVVRWIALRIDLEREIASDDCVLRVTGESKTYAACLTHVAELAAGVGGSLVAAAAAGGRSHLTRRVEMLLDRNRHTGTRVLRGRLVVLAAVMFLVAGLANWAPRLIAFEEQALLIPKALVVAARPEAVAPRPDPAPRPAPIPALSPTPEPMPLVAQAPAPSPNATPTPAPTPPAEPLRVRVNLTITDPMNRFVTGLGQQHFRLFEDGVEQQILEVAAEDIPLSVGIVLDTSGSMGATLGKARQAIAQVLSTARAEDDFLLVLTADRPTLAAGPGSKAEMILEKLSFVRAVGRTALLDGIELAAQNLKMTRNRPLVVVISDGGENASQYGESEIRAVVRDAGAPIYAITLGGAPADGTINGPQVLRTITSMVGGQVFTPDNIEELPAVARKIRVEVTNQYVLSYLPSNALHDGKFRKLQVEIVQPVGLPQLRVRHRQGYYAPSQ